VYSVLFIKLLVVFSAEWEVSDIIVINCHSTGIYFTSCIQ